MTMNASSARGMRYGLDISPVGAWGRPDKIAELAKLAEDHGWDGVFCEDYLSAPGGLTTYDVWVTVGLVAQATTHLTFGTMVTPLPCRHVPTLAVQVRSVAAISGGRLVLGAGSGDPEGDPVIRRDVSRAKLLDSALAEIRSTVPDVPIWIGGAISKPGPRARALRWDGACLYGVPPPDWLDLTPEDVAGLRAEAADPSYVVAVGGRQRRDDAASERRYVASLAAAGADWWHEYLPPSMPYDEALSRIKAGPVTA